MSKDKNKGKKNRGFMGIIKDGLSYAAQRILEDISPSMAESVGKMVQNLEDRIIQIEERMIRKMFSFLLIGFGAIFLAISLFFFLREFLGWSNSACYFSIGMIMLVAGLLLNAADRRGGKK